MPVLNPNPNRSHPTTRILALLLLALAPAWCAPLPDAPPGSPVARDFTFFLLSDVHVGARNGTNEPPSTQTEMVASAKAHLEVMRHLVGQPYPAQPEFAGLNLGTITTPRGLFVLGDLTDGAKELAGRQGRAGF